MSLIAAGLIFGLVARFFIAAIHFASDVFYKYVRYLPLRTMAGGIVIMHSLCSLRISNTMAWVQIKSFHLFMCRLSFTTFLTRPFLLPLL